ncbi:PemK family transcriptional regulator [Sulfobacillus thermosulfidooxidans]|uniref:mRNA interferase n=2 Tax=Sulfobacillus thermosulfidooxidans TaxID=28034 RepID=A0A1W1WGV9_SULTA|nr:PemK family transcriptional regulator [Sulfobacillus thermosulfidooxidans]OLZ15689.1 PemK family transcriptional regulator [Sulfobacillus thermosulfidooxidans]OLZ18465.1 PemK family transcriptional regulator [Sulfobacillus thermosulfidooxidans]PSR28181.1 MAG: type II toxin-antitoxin system PemK/MazF family toxin [Sulfobacillus thermosulfidooxidans]SMC05419.1 mRNA interferase MazF [Sulfobacillus thermosulfidooxidans DSM 9293]
MATSDIVVKRGDIFFADLSPVVGSEQGGIRPVLILQNDIGNRYSPTTIICAVTSQIFKTRLPIHVDLKAEESNLDRDSVILLEQIRTIDKRRLKERIAHLSPEVMNRVNQAIVISLGLTDL